MHVHLICVGRRMPTWVEAGYQEYAKRLPPECTLQLIEVEPMRRGKTGSRPGEAELAREDEAQRILKAIPKGAGVVALDGRGEGWTTPDLAGQLKDWLRGGRDQALLVGGPDGLAPSCLARADRCWSLSRLTFPHPLVRVILAEQVYRAWTLLNGHPYHRG
ncbi:23S rRNA (pseudouridine(1915)-N(3))-methyltransferase RlmH [uncultured Thiodictyon sp.]|uniref:23S rRNA (pseudouridine(1915)-N(3))-methyltransferase RlmH n=1 Tax=uncultured Thiodictyon sp. TaxID=1846217 RepID=UPI0025F5CCDA|nr:23S rRNA (pseudouridine(1915)-N(3))-methyltransferase RlmH [uncultured Thiodictyon sp.]